MANILIDSRLNGGIRGSTYNNADNDIQIPPRARPGRQWILSTILSTWGAKEVLRVWLAALLDVGGYINDESSDDPYNATIPIQDAAEAASLPHQDKNHSSIRFLTMKIYWHIDADWLMDRLYLRLSPGYRHTELSGKYYIKGVTVEILVD